MWPSQRLIDLLQIDHPLILAPMTGAGTIELAASVCAAGGLGSISCATLQPQVATETIARLRALTSRPINVNFFCHATAQADLHREQAWRDRLSPYYRILGLDPLLPTPRMDIPRFGDALCAVVEETKPEVVSFHFGLLEPRLLSRVKAAGCCVISSATTVEEACWLEAHGAVVVIAQGYEAGGHRAMFLAEDIKQEIASQPGTLALVPQVVDAVRVPVVAAGGITDGRGTAAAFALGAAGAQLGTAYLLCPETEVPPVYRDALRSARADTTVLTNVFTGRPARVLSSQLAHEFGLVSEDAPEFPTAMAALALLRAAAERDGCSNFTPLWPGQAASLAREISGEALTRALAEEALERLRTPVGSHGHRAASIGQNVTDNNQ